MRKSVLAGSLAVAVLGGCANVNWTQGVRQWWTLSERDLAAVTPDKKQDDVERMLGKPLLIETFSNLNEEVWDYRFLNGGVEGWAAEIHFDMKDGPTRVVTYPDACPTDAIGCP